MTKHIYAPLRSAALRTVHYWRTLPEWSCAKFDISLQLPKSSISRVARNASV
jgi:hypothetical protein